mmetsp:Transcript_30288/g.69816  ORF Transcript_30288/g.69816 Transcript_30288/m.69816 type:complete len:244 (+) Transcript_30288:125-856(+)
MQSQHTPTTTTMIKNREGEPPNEKQIHQGSRRRILETTRQRLVEVAKQGDKDLSASIRSLRRACSKKSTHGGLGGGGGNDGNNNKEATEENNDKQLNNKEPEECQLEDVSTNSNGRPSLKAVKVNWDLFPSTDRNHLPGGNVHFVSESTRNLMGGLSELVGPGKEESVRNMILGEEEEEEEKDQSGKNLGDDAAFPQQQQQQQNTIQPIRIRKLKRKDVMGKDHHRHHHSTPTNKTTVLRSHC